MTTTKKPKSKKTVADRATTYAMEVLDGTIVSGPHVRDACQRFLNDLERAKSGWDYYYDYEEASESMAFYEEVLKLNGGQFEGKPFILFPWQAFIVSNIFGWKKVSDGMRRFQVCFVLTGKGSGKTPLCSGTGIKGLVADNEPRAEIYSCATFQSQAMVLFRDAIAFYDQSPQLKSRLKSSGAGEKRWNLYYPGTDSFFRVISSEKKGQSGPRPHMILLDEVHEFADGTLIDILRAGFKFRRQPLAFLITNSGADATSVCWEYQDLGIKVAAGVLKNEEFFSYVCALDPEDFLDEDGAEDDHYLDDESLWPKVNPSLPYGIPGYDYIRSQIREARGLPSKMSSVKRLSFCVWVESENPAISKEVWMACQDKDYDVSLLKNRRCWGGLDLSAVNDLTAFALMFEPSSEDPLWRLKVWFWLPGIGLERKAEVDHVPYPAWRDANHINAIKRKTVEYDFVITDIVETCSMYNIQQIAFDRWNKKNFDKEVERMGVTLPEMVEFGQGYKSMGPAVKVFETKLIENTFRHDGNPCLTWNAANVVAVEDPTLAKKYDKKKSTGRIDGIIATVMACGILQDTEVSAYDGLTVEEMVKRMKGG